MLLEIKIKPRGNFHLFPPAIFHEATRAHIKKLVDDMVVPFQADPIYFWINFHEICLQLPPNITDEAFEAFFIKLKTFFKQQLYTLPLLRDVDFIIEVSNFSKIAVIFHDKHESILNALFEKYNKRTIVSRTNDNPLDSVLRSCAASGNVEDLQQIIQLIGDIDAQDTQTHRRAALHWAVLKERAACVRLLLDRGARLDIVDADGLTPFDYNEQNPNEEVRAVISNYVSAHFKIKWDEFISFVHIQFELCSPHQQSIIRRLYLALNYACMNDEFRTQKIRYLFNHGCTIVLFVDFKSSKESCHAAASYNSDVNMISFDKDYLESSFTTPHSLTRTFSHECEHGFQAHQNRFLNHNNPSLPKDGVPFYPRTMVELQKVVNFIKQGDQRIHDVRNTLRTWIGGQERGEIPIEKLYILERRCKKYLSNVHIIYSIPRSALLERFNMWEPTKEQIRQILPQACDTAGNIVDSELVLQKLEEIVHRHKYPLKFLFYSYPLLMDGEEINLEVIITKVLETAELVDGEKQISMMSDLKRTGIASLFHDTLYRYHSVNRKKGFNALYQCVEQHAAVMGEYSDTVLQEFYSELYRYSKSLAEKVFAGETADLSQCDVKAADKDKISASTQLTIHDGLMKHLTPCRNAGNELFFESLEQGNYSQALRRLCNWRNPLVLKMLPILISYRHILTINFDEQTGDKQQAAIHLAAQSNNEAAVKMLISAGASATLKDKTGQTAADYLAKFAIPAGTNPGNAPISDASIRALTDPSSRLSAISTTQPSVPMANASPAVTTTTTTPTRGLH